MGQLATGIASWGGLYLLAARLKARIDVLALVQSTLAPSTLLQSGTSTN